MAYIKYKEITKYFYFKKVVERSRIPKYVTDYVFEGETILTVYETNSDHGAFTDTKMVLFDLGSTFGIAKQIYTIPYKSISSISIIFKKNAASLVMMLDSGYPVHLKFINMTGKDKLRLRYLYTIISQNINNQKIDKNIIEKLVTENLSFE